MCGIGVTCLFGLINGLLVSRIKLPSFIVTLGTMNIAFALTQIYSGSQTVQNLPEPDARRSHGTINPAGLMISNHARFIEAIHEKKKK